MISYVRHEGATACSPHQHPCGFDSPQMPAHFDFDFTVASLLQHLRQPYQYCLDFRLEAFCSASSRLPSKKTDLGRSCWLNRSFPQGLVSKSPESGTFAILVDRVHCMLLTRGGFGSDHGEVSCEWKLAGCHCGQG